MSSKPKKNVEGRHFPGDPQRRVSSITRKLHWHWIWRRLGSIVFWDILICALACVGWCISREFIGLGAVTLANQRMLTGVGKMVVYQVHDPAGKLLLQAPIASAARNLAAAMSGLVCFQGLGFLFSFFREERKIRRILAPINEIAVRADELSRLSFSEDKFQLIEAAIEHIDPDEAGAEKPLSFGDSDLAGVEAAMNNLLLRMRDAYRQQARFVNDASHELRTPIAVIQGYANMLDRWGKTDEKILEESISAIKHESDHMNHLVEQLLFLARGDSGKTTLALSQVSVGSLMREVYEESFMIDEAHRYRLQLPEETPEITADPGLLKQAVRILTDNAAKYTPEGEAILLSAGKTEKGEAYLQVQDLGIGMEESEISHIFDRFFRSDEVRAKAGTGLGLSIAKWIVDKHGGYFEVLSRRDLGTRIRIVLPRNGSAGNTAAAAAEQPVSAD